MADKISLISDKKIEELLFTAVSLDEVLERYSHNDVLKKMGKTRDECEKQAYIEAKRIAFWFAERGGGLYSAEVGEEAREELWKEFLKEQNGTS